MAVQIQFRRGTAAQWTSADPILAEGEMGIETDTSRFKIGNGSDAWTALSYSSLPSTALSTTTIDAKGDLLVGTADNTVARVAVGTNNFALVADSGQTAGVKWAAVGDVTLAGTQTLTNKTLTAPLITEPVLRGAEERWNIVASASTGTINVDVLTSSVWRYTSNATANWTLNFRGSSGSTLSSILAVGDSVTVVFAATIGATQYRPTTFQVDGSAVTPLWQGGTAPTAGNANSHDIYVFTILRTSTASFEVYASQTKFA